MKVFDPDPDAVPRARLAPPQRPAPLRRRLAACQHRALTGARALAFLERRQAQAQRLRAVLPALAAAYPPATDARAARWLPQFAALADERLGPAAGAALALALARQRAVELEAAQLRIWLDEPA